MRILEELKQEMEGLESEDIHDGYWHSMGSVLVQCQEKVPPK